MFQRKKKWLRPKIVILARESHRQENILRSCKYVYPLSGPDGKDYGCYHFFNERYCGGNWCDQMANS